ncbi:transcriptional regulator [Methyloversatilis discipulorum]|uniref:transcriptional regulator n=1 Tax=Methyloversatilis discipulorum TaxID=1119528 RepID=UPI0031380342
MDLHKYLTDVEPAVELARRLDVPPPLLSQWRNRVRPVPEGRCVDIEEATNGLVTREELRPDLAKRWAYLRGTAAKDASSEAAA